jgi:hypothetical protein
VHGSTYDLVEVRPFWFDYVVLPVGSQHRAMSFVVTIVSGDPIGAGEDCEKIG